MPTIFTAEEIKNISPVELPLNSAREALAYGIIELDAYNNINRVILNSSTRVLWQATSEKKDQNWIIHLKSTNSIPYTCMIKLNSDGQELEFKRCGHNK